jgi:hypothetical protein
MTARLDRAARPATTAPAVLAPLWRRIAPDGVIGLGGAGAAAAAVSTVNFALRSPEEQDARAAAYDWWLNSLTGPVQILIRAGRADLSAAVATCATPRQACRTRPWSTPRWSTHPSLRGWPPSGTCSPGQALLICREPGHGTGRPGGADAAKPARDDSYAHGAPRSSSMSLTPAG